MGLFSKAIHWNKRRGGKKTGKKKKGGKAGAEFDARTWILALDRSEGDARGRRVLSDSTTALKTALKTLAATDDGASASAAPSDGADGVRRLEQRLRQSDATVARLRGAMEAGERVRSDRIALLELQLERLVELPSSGRERRERVATLDPGEEGSSPQAQDASLEERRFNLEMSALNELLAKVIAEKDRLGSENERLRSLVKQRSGHSVVCKMPPSFVELDAMIKAENEENCREQGSCQYGLGPSKPPKEVPSVLYKMSCRDCPQDQSRLRYVGTYAPTAAADPATELTRVVKAHYSQIWRMVLEESGGLSLNSLEEWDGDGRDFPTSSLARYCFENCKRFSNKEEVMRWFRDNIKVEVQRNVIKAQVANAIKAERKERKEKILRPGDKKRWRIVNSS